MILQIDSTVILAVMGLIVAGCFIAVVAVLSKSFRRCPSNKLLIVFGSGIKGTVHVQHGGARLVWPLIQDYCYLSLEPMVVDLGEGACFSRDQVEVRVSGEVVAAIGTMQLQMQAAAQRLIGMSDVEIRRIARDEAQAALREVVAELKAEWVTMDREKFGQEIELALEHRLEPYGIEVVNIRLGEIRDSAGHWNRRAREDAEIAARYAREDAEIKARREKEEAEFQKQNERALAEIAKRHGMAPPKPAIDKPSADVLKDDPGDVLRKM